MILLGLLTAWALLHAFFESWGWVIRFRAWRAREWGGRTSLDRGIAPRRLVGLPSTNPIRFGRVQTRPMSRLTLVR